MLNEANSDLQAKTIFWMGILPEEVERQEKWTSQEIDLAFESGKKIKKNGVEFHFISVPTTPQVGFGIKLLEFDSSELKTIKFEDLIFGCGILKEKLGGALKELGFYNVDKIISMFFTTEVSFRRKTQYP